MTPEDRQVLARDRALCRRGPVTQARIDDLAGQWLARLGPPDPAAEREALVLVDAGGRPAEPRCLAPRWLCHLLGLRHPCVHVMIWWSSPGLGPVIVCQVRSWTKRDFPGHLDISVGGHRVGDAAPYASALREMREELGLTEADLVGGEMAPAGTYECTVQDERTGFFDVEWRHVFVARVRDLSAVRFEDGEVGGLYLCPVAGATALLTQDRLAVADGLKFSLPLCLDYLSQRPTG